MLYQLVNKTLETRLLFLLKPICSIIEINLSISLLCGVRKYTVLGPEVLRALKIWSEDPQPQPRLHPTASQSQSLEIVLRSAKKTPGNPNNLLSPSSQTPQPPYSQSRIGQGL